MQSKRSRQAAAPNRRPSSVSVTSTADQQISVWQLGRLWYRETSSMSALLPPARVPFHDLAAQFVCGVLSHAPSTIHRTQLANLMLGLSLYSASLCRLRTRCTTDSCLGILWATIRYPCLRSCVRRSSLLSSPSNSAPAILISQIQAWVRIRMVRIEKLLLLDMSLL
jgi:hypothetical protein